MPEEKPPIGSVNFSGISDSDIKIDDLTVTTQAGGDIVGRDKLTIGQQIINMVTGSPDKHSNLRDRQVMLTAVWQFWIEGVLEQSLYKAAVIELGLEEKKEALAYPWDMVLQQPNHPSRLLPPDTKMIEVFETSAVFFVR